MSFLKIKNITKRYTVKNENIEVLEDFSMEMERGMIHSIVGPSGCGKTTLLMLCGALIFPDSGTIVVDDVSLLSLNPGERARKRADLIGFVFQRFHLIPYLNVEQNILVSCIARPIKDAQERCNELLDRLGLESRRYHIPAKLSAGEQQRVALGRALMNRPAMLVADEPTGNLDEDNANHLLELLQDYAKEGGMVLIATHDSRVANISDHKYIYKNGVFA